jgi:hypothetical protein
MQRIFVKKCFLFTVGSVYRVRRLTTGSRNSLKDVRKSRMMPEQVRKWLRLQSKDLYGTGFDSLVKRWDECICWWRICREIQAFLQVGISHVLRVISICDLILSLTRKKIPRFRPFRPIYEGSIQVKSRLQWQRGLRHEPWDCGFESHSRYGCLCVFILCLCCPVCR